MKYLLPQLSCETLDLRNRGHGALKDTNDSRTFPRTFPMISPLSYLASVSYTVGRNSCSEQSPGGTRHTMHPEPEELDGHVCACTRVCVCVCVCGEGWVHVAVTMDFYEMETMCICLQVFNNKCSPNRVSPW